MQQRGLNNNEDINIMKKLIAGNWKMNGSLAQTKVLVSDIAAIIEQTPDLLQSCDILMCPPSLYIGAVMEMSDDSGAFSYGAQDCSAQENGAYTGEISANMLVDMGCEYVILGHSERRTNHNETNEIVKQKAVAAHARGLIAIICIGEQEADRDAGTHENVVGTQLAESLPEGATDQNTVIAYEPVWAIGTGKTARPEDVKSMHEFIRNKLEGAAQNPQQVRILYGGSMKADNAPDLLATPNVDGGLIGGASLSADSFLAIAKAA